MQKLESAYLFNIGNFKCRVIKDGTLMAPGQDNRPVPVMDVSCLLVETDKHTVLIDAGFGEQPFINGIRQTKVGKALEVLKAESVGIASIDSVILSHLHPDHVGGITDDNGKAVFPGASYFILRKEWDFWNNNPDLSRVDTNIKKHILDILKKKILPVRERFILVEGEIDILPGIKIIDSAGHTPGHINLNITSGQEQLVCIFDIMHSSLEFTRPDILDASDMLPDQARINRNEAFSRIANSGALVFATHFTFPGLGYIVKKETGYAWQPLK